MPSIAQEIRLSPLAKSVLLHLEKRPDFSRRKAEVYGIDSLARGIWELKRAGYRISKELKYDDFGRRYASYTLMKEEAVAA